MRDSGWGVVVRWCGVSLVAAVAGLCTAWPPYANAPPIRSDGLGYHAWTRAILTWDFTFCRHVHDAGAEQFASLDYARGRCQLRYPPGLALLQLPVMAFLVQKGADAPFVSPAEHQAALILGALALTLVALLITDASRRLGAPPSASSVAVVTAVFGTGLLHYGTYDASFTHVYSALGFSLLLWLGARSAEKQRAIPVWPLVLIGFFLVLLRATNVLLLVASAVVAAVALRPPGASWRDRTSMMRALRNVAPAAFGAFLAEIVQLSYNRYASGHFTFSSYGPVRFRFAVPHQLDVLVSYERGLLTWYPWVALAIVVALISKRVRPFGFALVALVVAYAVMYGFWPSWCLGGGFGHRGFIELVPAAALCFAMGLVDLASTTRWIVLGAALLATVATVELLAGYWAHTIDYGGNNWRIYWAHVLGKNSLLLRPALDLDRGPPVRDNTCPSGGSL